MRYINLLVEVSQVKFVLISVFLSANRILETMGDTKKKLFANFYPDSIRDQRRLIRGNVL